MSVEIPAGTGVRIQLARGQQLRIIDPHGGQSGDLMALCADDPTEWLSNGRSFDDGGKIYLSTGDVLYSNLSRPLLTIVADDAGRHDFLYTACSREMYRLQYGLDDAPNCLDNLSGALGISPRSLPTPFNLFMRATVQPDGRLVIAPPATQAGSAITFRAELDLAVAPPPVRPCNATAAAPSRSRTRSAKCDDRRILLLHRTSPRSHGAAPSAPPPGSPPPSFCDRVIGTLRSEN